MDDVTRKALVQPQTLKGFQDLLPEAMIARNSVIGVIQSIYEKYGFVPLETPVLEYLPTLVGQGGEMVDKELFRLESPEREPIALRFDLTVPFARLIAQYPETLKLPFRRYHIGPVFRADKPGPGRFRQFTQFDIDIAGSYSLVADAEIVAAMAEALRSVGLSNEFGSEFVIRINNRHLVDALLIGNEISDLEVQKHVLRVVDKLQKVGVENIRAELGRGRIDDSGDEIRGVGLEPKVVEAIISFIAVKASSRTEVISSLSEVLPKSESSDAALLEMTELAVALESLSVSEKDAIFDPSLARGLDYYTGTVFEAFLPIAPSFGSVMGGGRYDGLVERFLDERIPATGASIGIDRLMAALTEIGKVRSVVTNTKVIILAMKGIPVDELLKVATSLRLENIPTEVFLGQPGTSVREQLSYANTKRIPIAVMLGEDELKSGQISVKDLEFGRLSRSEIQDREEYQKAGRVGQRTIPMAVLVETVKEML